MKARYQNGKIGRFLSQDNAVINGQFDLSDPQSLNYYAYARNNPLRYVDPDGNSPQDYANGLKGYGVGLLQGVGNVASSIGNAVAHPVDTAKSIGSFFAEGAAAGGQLARDLSSNPSQTLNEIGSGTAIATNEFLNSSPYQQGRAIGTITGEAATNVAISAGVSKVANSFSSSAADISTPYKRPSNATTPAQRAYVQGKSCVNCGSMSETMVADHKVPLVKEYYATGKINTENMRSINAVQPQCPSCSAQQGGQLSNYSKQMKSNYGFNK